MNYYLSAYADYFRYLCTQHPEVMHSELSGHRAFEVRPLEEAFSDVRTSATTKGVLVHLLLPAITYGADQGGNARKVYEFGLLVAKWHGSRESTKKTILDAMSAAERIADELVARLVADSRAGVGLFQYGLDNPDNLGLSGEFVSLEGDASYSGVVYTFKVPAWRCLDVADVAWIDSGTTPSTIPTLLQ